MSRDNFNVLKFIIVALIQSLFMLGINVWFDKKDVLCGINVVLLSNVVKSLSSLLYVLSELKSLYHCMCDLYLL